jgi:hypothetical protein
MPLGRVCVCTSTVYQMQPPLAFVWHTAVLEVLTKAAMSSAENLLRLFREKVRLPRDIDDDGEKLLPYMFARCMRNLCGMSLRLSWHSMSVG